MTLIAKIGISAIAWLNDDMPELTKHISLEQALSDMQKIGFSGTENGGAFPDDSGELQALLSQYELELVSGWYSGTLGKNSFGDEVKAIDKQLRLFRDLGTKVIVYGETSGVDLDNPMSIKPQLADFSAYAEKLENLAKYCNDFGVPLALHHHMGTMVESMEEIDQVMEKTQELTITFDTGHCLMAGGDPVVTCSKYADRIAHFHLKDIRKPVLDGLDFEKESFKTAFIKGAFTVPGDGCIDFDALFDIVKQAKYSGWFVIEAEQDPHVADPYQYSAMGYTYVHSLLSKHGYRIIQ